MNSVKTECAVGDMSQYREGVASDCTGQLHRLEVQWEMQGGRMVQGENSVAAVVCDGHLQAFRDLGQREGYRFSIVSDEVIESPMDGEREK